MDAKELPEELGERVVKFGMPIGPEIARAVLDCINELGFDVVKMTMIGSVHEGPEPSKRLHFHGPTTVHMNDRSCYVLDDIWVE